MPASYSYDLRTKVIGALDDGMGKSRASRLYKISRNTIDLWLKQRKETGDYRPKVGYQQGYKPKITDLGKFQEFAQVQGSKTQKEMAQAWSEDISDRTIGKALKKIGYARKKNLRLSR